jgi:hypothetical protein
LKQNHALRDVFIFKKLFNVADAKSILKKKRLQSENICWIYQEGDQMFVFTQDMSRIFSKNLKICLYKCNKTPKNGGVSYF